MLSIIDYGLYNTGVIPFFNGHAVFNKSIGFSDCGLQRVDARTLKSVPILHITGYIHVKVWHTFSLLYTLNTADKFKL